MSRYTIAKKMDPNGEYKDKLWFLDIKQIEDTLNRIQCRPEEKVRELRYKRRYQIKTIHVDLMNTVDSLHYITVRTHTRKKTVEELERIESRIRVLKQVVDNLDKEIR